MSRNALDPVEARVRHPELLALVDVRRPAVQVQDRAEHLRGAHAVLGRVVAEARHDPRLVVVVPVERVPAALGEPLLPAAERALEVGQPQARDVPLQLALVEPDVLELEDHVELASRRVGEQLRVLERDVGHLADRQRLLLAPVEHLAVHLLQELVDPRAGDPAVLGPVGVLGEHVDDVHAEAVDPAVEPPAHHRVDRLADLRVLPVEVGHRGREQVQVVLRRSPRRAPTSGPRSTSATRWARRATSTSRASGCRGSSATRGNHGCCAEVWLTTRSITSFIPRAWMAASRRSKSSSEPNVGSMPW